MSRIARAGLTVVSVLMLVWLGVLLRDSVLISRVSAIASERAPSADELRHAQSMASDAGLLNPDRSVPLSWRAELDILQHRKASAVAAYQQLVRDEPLSADAWFLLGSRAKQSDPRLSARAYARLHELDPRY